MAMNIEKMIFIIRDRKVMLEKDLALLYQVETKALKRAVRRNIDRFPADFMFELAQKEMENVRCQIGTILYVQSPNLSQHIFATA